MVTNFRVKLTANEDKICRSSLISSMVFLTSGESLRKVSRSTTNYKTFYNWCAAIFWIQVSVCTCNSSLNSVLISMSYFKSRSSGLWRGRIPSFRKAVLPPDVPMVLFDPGLNGTPGLSNEDLPTPSCGWRTRHALPSEGHPTTTPLPLFHQ
jgi:hypothetical protein